MDDTDKEIEAHEHVMPGVTPAALLDAMERPEQFAEWARADLFLHMAHLRRVSAHPDFPTSSRIEIAKFLAKMGKVDAPLQDANPLAGMPMIEIDLGAAGTVKIGAPTPAPRQEVDITPDEHDVTKQSKAVLP